MSTMKALVFRGAHEIGIECAPIPTVGVGEVVVRTERSRPPVKSTTIRWWQFPCTIDTTKR